MKTRRRSVIWDWWRQRDFDWWWRFVKMSIHVPPDKHIKHIKQKATSWCQETLCHLSQGTWSPRCFGYVPTIYPWAERIQHCCLFADSFGEWCSEPKQKRSRRCLLLIYIIYMYIYIAAEGHKNVRLASHTMISSLNSTRLACASSLHPNCRYQSLH